MSVYYIEVTTLQYYYTYLIELHSTRGGTAFTGKYNLIKYYQQTDRPRRLILRSVKLRQFFVYDLSARFISS